MTELEVEDGDQRKYIVFKLEDWQRMRGEQKTGDWMAQVALDDAVVIRMKDPFAATALFTYCNTIMSLLELMEDSMTGEEYQRMLDIADYFHGVALESEKIKGKRLPD